MSHNHDVRKIGLGVSPGICSGRAVVLADDPSGQGGGQDGFAGEPVVLVGHDFSGEDVLSMDLDTVGGFVTLAGGRTAPAGIVAQAAGIPAVMACPLGNAVKTGDQLIIDGTSGEVHINPSPEVIDRVNQRRSLYRSCQEEMAGHLHLPAETRDGWKVDVFANVDLADAIPGAITGGAGGIGLFRSEFYYLTGDGAPSEEFLFTLYQHVLASVAPLPVTIRTLDLSGGSQVHGLGQTLEQNPALGLKGIRFSLAHPALFKTQLRALYRAAVFGRLRIVLPMVSSLDELRLAKGIIAEIKIELGREGARFGDDVEIGLMLEVPGAVVVAEHLAREVDFFSIGINDLLQYTLALDRVNGGVADLYEPLDPGVMRMIQMVVLAGHGEGIDVGICGEMAGNPAYVPLLLGLGLDFLSMPVTSIGGVKKVVRESRIEDCSGLADGLLQQDSARAARGCLQDYLAAHHPHMDQPPSAMECHGRA